MFLTKAGHLADPAIASTYDETVCEGLVGGGLFSASYQQQKIHRIHHYHHLPTTIEDNTHCMHEQAKFGGSCACPKISIECITMMVQRPQGYLVNHIQLLGTMSTLPVTWGCGLTCSAEP